MTSPQLDLFNQPLPDPEREMIGRFHSDGRATELHAAARDLPKRGTQRARVLEAIQNAPDGVTDYELWHVHGVGARPHVPGTRREELIRDGWPIRDSGRRRQTDTGSPAIVWVYEGAV